MGAAKARGRDKLEWKQIVTATITGILVTVLSGIAVWYLTYEGAKSEGVVYEISNSGQFGNGSTGLTFANVQIRNSGSLKAEQVVVNISERNEAEISESQISKSSPLLEVTPSKTESNSFRFTIKKFLPGESVDIGLLFRGKSRVYLDISGRTNENIISKAQKKQQSKSNRYFLFLFLVAFSIIAINARGLSKFIFRRYIRSYPPSKNNSAFLLTHGGFSEKSVSILESAIRNGECSPFEFSNLALAKELQGDADEATRLIGLATRWASTPIEISITLFNSSIIDANRGNIEAASEKLKQAIETNLEIKEYCKNSTVLHDLFRDNDEYRETYENSKFKKKHIIGKIISN